MKNTQPTAQYFYLFILFAAYTFINCQLVADWLIENILVATFLIYLSVKQLDHRFRFGHLSMVCIFGFLCLHEWGAQYVYSQHPLGEYMRTSMHLQRNGYDRLVHFSFGFLLYYPMQQLLVHRFKMPWHRVNFRVLEIILSLAAAFELIEFAVANYVFPDTLGKTYVGTQGDAWDAQKDIVMALIGCALATGIYKISTSVIKKLLPFSL
jgi:putative membrane protein